MNAAQKRLYRLENEKIPRLILSMAAPAIAGMLISAIYNMADTFFVSRLGTSASAAVGIVFPLMSIISALGLTFGVGAGSYISRLLGQKEKKEASRVVSTALFTVLGLSVIIMIAGIVFLDPLLRLMGATPTNIVHARDYALYILMGTPFFALSFVLNNALRAEGSAVLSMVGMMAGGFLNMILDPIFIFGLNMGVAGAAIATSVSQFVSFCILSANYITKRSALRIHPRYFSPRWPMYQEILKIGLPSMLREGMTSIAIVILNNTAAPYGDAAIAAMSIVSRVFWFFFSILIGLGQGYQPVVGFNYGARRSDRVWEGYWFTLKVGTLFVTAAAAIILAFAPQIMMIFRADDPEVIRLGSMALRFQAAVLPLQATVMTLNMLYQALGRGLPAAALSFSRQGLFLIPALILLPRIFGLDGLVACQATADLCAFFLALAMAPRIIREMKTAKDDYYAMQQVA